MSDICASKEVLLKLIYCFIDNKSASETIHQSQRQILWPETYNKGIYDKTVKIFVFRHLFATCFP